MPTAPLPPGLIPSPPEPSAHKEVPREPDLILRPGDEINFQPDREATMAAGAPMPLYRVGIKTGEDVATTDLVVDHDIAGLMRGVLRLARTNPEIYGWDLDAHHIPHPQWTTANSVPFQTETEKGIDITISDDRTAGGEDVIIRMITEAHGAEDPAGPEIGRMKRLASQATGTSVGAGALS